MIAKHLLIKLKNHRYAIRLHAFTFVEMLLYIGLVSVFVVTISAFIGFFSQARVKSNTIEEVNFQALLLTQKIDQLIRDSDSISTPTIGTNSSSLTLTSTKYPTRSPIIISMIGGKIFITEGAGASVQFSSNSVTVESISFTNSSQLSTNGNITYAFTLNYNNSSGRNEFKFRQTYNGASSTR